jgi:hypothetical protein
MLNCHVAVIENMKISIHFIVNGNKVKVYINVPASVMCPFHMLPCNLRFP